MSNENLEREDGRPAQWRTNVVMRRDAVGNVARVEPEKGDSERDEDD